jgi:hypothetical protein
MVDKYAVKRYIAEKLGPEYVIPLIGGPWARAEDIDFDALPETFVLKCTHDSGSVILCRDRADFDREQTRAKLARFLRRDYWRRFREWPYKDVPPRVIAEELIGNGNLTDYKVMCFNGEPKIIQVHMNRFSGHTVDFYNMDWQRIDVVPDTPTAPTPLPRPPFLDRLLELSRFLSAGLLHVRVDWYCTEGRIYFGEFTFYDNAGMTPFRTREDDLAGGALLDLGLPAKTEEN